jgi:hypothetical protein
VVRCDVRNRMLILAMALCAVCAGCGYGDLSPDAYSYAKAIDGVASRRAADRVAAVESQVDRALETGSLNDREADMLRDLLDYCRAEHWDDARRGARRLLESQARAAVPRVP